MGSRKVLVKRLKAITMRDLLPRLIKITKREAQSTIHYPQSTISYSNKYFPTLSHKYFLVCSNKYFPTWLNKYHLTWSSLKVYICHLVKFESMFRQVRKYLLNQVRNILLTKLKSICLTKLNKYLQILGKTNIF